MSASIQRLHVQTVATAVGNVRRALDTVNTRLAYDDLSMPGFIVGRKAAELRRLVNVVQQTVTALKKAVK